MSQATGGGRSGTPNGAVTTGPPRGERRSIGAVVSSVVDGAKTLVRKQVELAKIEATEAVGVRAKGAGLMGAAAVLGLFALGFAAASGSTALDLVLPRWAAHLIVAGVFALFAGALVLAGRRAMKTAPKTERTQETLKEDARWAKRQLAR
jgi:hypothetical protein